MLSEPPICADETTLYIHIPFCRDRCYYCACNKVVTRHNSKADIYLDYLEREMHLRASLLHHASIVQVHIGGGSPGFLTIAQHARLPLMIRAHVAVAPFSIELDLRHSTQAHLAWLRELGYQRLSFGLPDTNDEIPMKKSSTPSIVPKVRCI